jgi:hypothetical protein
MVEIETRYFTHEVFGVGERQLNIVNSDAHEIVGLLSGSRIGIRVFIRPADDSEHEVTAGSPVATAIYVGDGEYAVDWACPGHAMLATDHIVVKVYMTKAFPVSWALQRSFVTEELNAATLDAETWHVFYWLYMPSTTLNLWYGDAEADSRIEDFTWTEVVAPSAMLRRLLVGVGL